MRVLPHLLRHDRRVATGEVVHVALPPALHPAALGPMQVALEAPLRRGQVRLVVDVSDAEVVCTTAIGYLVWCIKRARDRGGDLHFCGSGSEPGGRFARLLDLCGVAPLFRTYASREAATRAFEARGTANRGG